MRNKLNLSPKNEQRVKLSVVLGIPLAVVSLAALLLSSGVERSVDLQSNVTLEYHACGDPEDFSVVLMNLDSLPVNGINIQVDLPPGIEYVTGSISETSSLNVQESDTSNLRSIAFTSDDLLAGEMLEFTIKTRALCGAIAYMQGGNLLENTVTLTHDDGSETHTSNSYNVKSAALTILSVTETSHTGYVGTSYERTLRIINGGNGRLSEFRLADSHNSNIQITGTNFGTLNATADTILFTSADFDSVGNNNGYFETNEIIEVIQTVEIIGCQNSTSTFDAFWGCGDTPTCQSSTSSSTTVAHTVVRTADPNLVRKTEPAFSGCPGQGPELQKLRIINTGMGPARSVAVELYQPSSTSYSQILDSTIRYRIGESSNFQNPTLTSRTGGQSYTCLYPNPTTKAKFDLPEIKTGDTVFIEFETFSCCPTTCQKASLLGWTSKLTYENACGNKTYTKTNTGQSSISKDLSLFAETPAYIFDGETKEWHFMVASEDMELPMEAKGRFEIEVDLPAGLTWTSGANDFSFTSGKKEWAASKVSFDANNRKLTGHFPTPMPNNFRLLRADIGFTLTMDCDQPGVQMGMNPQNVGVQTFFQIDTTCQSTCRIPLGCEASSITYVYCPGGPVCSGISLKTFEPYRTSVGLPDNDQNGNPDAGGSLNENKIRRNRAMFGDTIRMHYAGKVNRQSGDPTFSHGYLESTVPLGVNLSFVGGGISVYPRSGGTKNSTSIASSYTDKGTSRTFTLDYSPMTLGGDFSGYTFENGDSVVIDIDYKVTGNIGEKIEQVTVTNSVYLATKASPVSNDRFSCFDLPENITLIGYAFKTSGKENNTVNNCVKTIKQQYYLGIGPCCSNYNGGNLFPYEYRNWAHVSQVKLNLPEGYSMIGAKLKQWRTTYTGGSRGETQYNLTPDSTAGDTLYFNLAQYHKDQGGSIGYSDDGFYGRIYLDVASTCTKTPNVWENINWYYDLNKASVIGGGSTGWMTTTPDRIRYRPPNVQLSAQNPIIDGLNEQVEFKFDVKNLSTNGGAKNVWMVVTSPSGKININEVRNSSKQAMNLAGDIYQLGDIGANKTLSYSILASTSDCNKDSLKVYYGQECTGYPATMAEFNCPIDSFMLYVQPKDAELQLTLLQSAPELDVCDANPSFPIELEVASVIFASTKDITVDIVVPTNEGLGIVANSSQLRYPVGGQYATVSDPVKTQNSYRFDLNQISQVINDNNLPGIVKTDSNRFRLKFDMAVDISKFDQGDRFEIRVNGKQYCGQQLPELYLAHQRIYAESPFRSTFEMDTTATFMNTLSEGWSVSWNDFDEDGDLDIYATHHNKFEPNHLYVNNGDGTFSRNTTHLIVQDKGPSMASSWGDFNNDGHMDLFVSNNIGSPNWLYRNLGNGKFNRVSPTRNDQLGYKGYTFCSVWGDYDNDGFLDIFLVDFQNTRFNQLFRNNGNETFTKVGGGDISTESFRSISASWADFDNDDDLDLFLCNSYANNRLYRNEGNGIFRTTTGIESNDGGNSIGSSWGDYDNDGDLDLFVANAGANNFLYNNNGDGTFTKITSGSIVNDGGASHGSGFADYDNDGWLDLLVVNDNGNSKFLYQNQGDGTFLRINNEITGAIGGTRGMAWADFDNDGDLDVFMATTGNEPNLLFKNSRGKCIGNVNVDLKGSTSNAAAIGAKVKVKTVINGQEVWQLRQVTALSGGGVAGQGDPRVHFGVGDAPLIDSIVVEWPSGVVQYAVNQPVGDSDDPVTIPIVESTARDICGYVYSDQNSDCLKAPGESGIPGVQIEILPGPRYAYTDSTGYYSISLEPGEYTLKAQPDNNWTVECPTNTGNSHTVTVTAPGQECGYDFGLSAGCADPDLSVYSGTTALRRGFENTYSITYENNGGAPATDVILEFQMDPQIFPLWSSVAWDTLIASTNTARWNLGTIAVGSSTTIFLKDSVSARAPIGDSLDVVATISALEEDCAPSDDKHLLREMINGALDPNDKLVMPIGEIAEDELLTYRIRFQNVGNYPATFVILRDTISEHLDLNSLRMKTASHAYNVKREGNVMIWRFDDINLPDSASDEPNSHGFVQFTIRPVQDVPHRTQIRNRAAIFFDYNEPVITNYTFNSIQYVDKRPMAKEVSVFPNPVVDFAQVKLVPLVPGVDLRMSRIQISDLKGVTHKDYQLSRAREFGVKMSDLRAGMYVITSYDLSGRKYSAKVLKK
ncbi:MAG: FG-GAP-like repeat-containing protein [Bacteroidota bacterium]